MDSSTRTFVGADEVTSENGKKFLIDNQGVVVELVDGSIDQYSNGSNFATDQELRFAFYHSFAIADGGVLRVIYTYSSREGKDAFIPRSRIVCTYGPSGWSKVTGSPEVDRYFDESEEEYGETYEKRNPSPK